MEASSSPDNILTANCVDEGDLVFENQKTVKSQTHVMAQQMACFIVVVLKISTTYDFTQDHISVGACEHKSSQKLL